MSHKTAVRLAFYMINASETEANEFVKSILDAKKNLKLCSKCFNISDTDPCEICSDPKRDQSKICVVEDVKDVIVIEKMHEYKGLYHVQILKLKEKQQQCIFLNWLNQWE